MKKKLLALVLVVALAVTSVIGGTMAYLTDTGNAVNTMTLGDVHIEQIEQEWNDAKSELVTFTQDKPLYPYVGELGWENKDVANGAYRCFTMNNVVDKYVSVKNTGKSDAYIRTVFAFEMGEYATVEEFRNKIIGVSRNALDGDEFKFDGAWVWGTPVVAQIDGENYMVWEAVHQNAVAGGETTIPSLLQVYMNKACDNEEVEKVDGNNNGKYDILVVSQAIQTEGFADAQTALNEGFGTITSTSHPWVNGIVGEKWDGTADGEGMVVDEENKTVDIYTPAQLAYFAKTVNGTGATTFSMRAASGNTYAGWTVRLAADIDLNKQPWTPIGLNADGANKFQGTFDGQNHTISNLNVNTENGYTAAGLFGALNGTAKNFTIKNATISHISTGNSTDNGIAVVAGSLYNVGYVDNVHVVNATVNGNRYVGGISGYTYGSVTNCSVTNSTLTATPDNLTGSYDNGDKVGGIAGYFASENTYKISGNSVSNVTITGYRDIGGIVGTADGANAVVNNTVSGLTLIQDNTHAYKTEEITTIDEVVGRVTKGELDESNTVVGDTGTSTGAGDGETLKEAVASGKNVVLTNDVDADASIGGYSNAGLVQNGTVIDGNGNELYVEGANGTWDCAIYTTGGTIKNLTIGGAFRGIFTAGCSEDIIIDNVVIDNVCYTISSDGSNANYSIIVTDSTLNGWTSYTSGYKSVSFTNCNFGKGTGGYQYAYCRPYSDTTFTNCTFAEGYEFDATKCTSTFVNCYVGDTLITAENVVSLLGEDAANVKIVVKNGDQESVSVATADQLTKGLANGGSVTLATNVKTNAAVYVTGGTLNGNGNTLDANDVKTSSWPNAYAVTLGNGGSTVENLTVINAGYAIGSTAATEDIYIKNVTTDYVTYAINGNGNGTNSVYVTDSTINGWNSYSNIKLFSFDNCKLAKGNSYDGYLVVYGDTTFTDCTFEDFAMCARNQDGAVVAAGKTVSFTNCSYVTAEGTVKVTAYNFKTLFKAEGDDTDFGYLSQCNVVIDGVKVSWN